MLALYLFFCVVLWTAEFMQACFPPPPTFHAAAASRLGCPEAVAAAARAAAAAAVGGRRGWAASAVQPSGTLAAQSISLALQPMTWLADAAQPQVPCYRRGCGVRCLAAPQPACPSITSPCIPPLPTIHAPRPAAGLPAQPPSAAHGGPGRNRVCAGLAAAGGGCCG